MKHPHWLWDIHEENPENWTKICDCGCGSREPITEADYYAFEKLLNQKAAQASARLN